MSIDERFAEFHALHPEVYRHFVALAHKARDAGHERYSADEICHRIRWHYKVERRGEDPFKLNDHFTSRYARKLMAEDPAFEGFFELRRLRSAS